MPIGVPTSWDEAGEATETKYEMGLAEAFRADEKKLDRTAKKIGKARDCYAKEKILSEVVGWGDRAL